MDVSWGFLGVLLQDFTKIQNLISLNISTLQLNFVFLQICICETALVRQLKQVSLRSLTRSFAFLRFANAKLLTSRHSPPRTRDSANPPCCI